MEVRRQTDSYQVMRLTVKQLRNIISEIADKKGLTALNTIKSYLYDQSVTLSSAETALRYIALLPGTDKEALRIVQNAMKDSTHGDFVVDSQLKAAFRRL